MQAETNASRPPAKNTLRSFLDEFLVECPKCGKPGTVQVVTTVAKKVIPQFACPSCGHIEQGLRESSVIIGTWVDPYLRIPLWLQTECCGEILWAYNRRHLAFLKEIVGSKLRDIGEPGRPNLGNKLPKWMLLAKNRDEVLRQIDRLMSKM